MIRYSKCRFEIELLDDNCPMGFWGSRLRGIYGHQIKKKFCLRPDERICLDCERPDSCAYPALFEPISGGTGRKGRRLPPAYIIEPPQVEGPNDQFYPRGTMIGFNLVSLGPRSNNIGHAVRAFKNGVIDNKGHFALRSVTDLLDGERPVDLSSDDVAVTSANILDLAGPRIWKYDQPFLKVEFTTNTRIENQNARMKDTLTGLTIFSDFFDLIYNIMLRFGGLWEFYGENWPGREEFKAGLDYHLKAAREISLVEHSLEMNRLKRRSSRKIEQLPIDGFTGRMVFAGDTANFSHLLRIGEILHIGSYTNIGLGRYIVTPLPSI